MQLWRPYGVAGGLPPARFEHAGADSGAALLLAGALDLLDGYGVHLHPQVDAAVELGAAGKVQTQHQRTIGPLRREGLGLLLAQTLAGGTEMF